MTSGPPVFIVGLPRSGTTLLTAMLGAHSRMDCGPETHFFAQVRRARLRRILDPGKWPASGVEFVTSLVVDGEPLHEQFGVSAVEVERFLRERVPSVQALLESLTVTRARHAGKARWIEKTPNHLLHLERIRALYPDAQIVRILRDPRDVALSLRKVPFASPSALANLYSWVERDERSWQFFLADRGSLVVRYEDLVTDPLAEVQRLCAFLGEAVEPEMLQPHRAAEGIIGSGEWWKDNVRRPITSGRVQAWQRELSAGEQRVASLVCAEPLRRYGYPGGVEPGETLVCQPLSAPFIERHEADLIALADRGIRLWPCDPSREAPDLVWGLPGQLRWSLGATAAARAEATVKLAARLLSRRVKGPAVRWLAEDSQLPVRRGAIDRLCDWAVRLAARKERRADLMAGADEPVTTSAASLRR